MIARRLSSRIVAAMFLTACGGTPASQPAPHAPAASRAAPAPAPSPAPSPAPAPAPLLPRPGATGRLPVGSGDFGAASPTLIRAVDPGERWMALCQARTDTNDDGKLEIYFGHHGEVYGDSMELFLVLGGGTGTPIDAFGGRSADGRWLVILRDGKSELVDAQTGDTFALRDADTVPDGRAGAPHRAAMFAGNRLLYIRHLAAGDDKLVVHDPADHSERELTVPDRLWRIDHNPDRIARIYTVPQGKPFPSLQTNLSGGECIGPAMSSSSFGSYGSRPTERWIDLDTGAELAADGAQIAVGTTLVRTPAGGALYFGADLIAPPSCRALLLAVLPSPVRAIAICGEKKQARILLLGKGLRKELASIDRETAYYNGLSSTLAPAPGVVCAAGRHCVATATGASIDLKGGSTEYAWGSKLYVVHGLMPSPTYELVDVVTGTRTPLRTADIRMAEGKFLLDRADNIIDLDAAVVLGKVPSALHVSTAGRGLRSVPAMKATIAPWIGDPIDGPLRWVAP